MVERRHEMGSGGYCFCPKCDRKFPHMRGVPCQEQRCPDCGAKLMREGSYHHELLEKKRGKNSSKVE